MKKNIVYIITLLLFINVNAQNQIIKIWPEGIPLSINDPSYQEVLHNEHENNFYITKVTDPTLTVYTPSKSTSNNTAVIICPGGGYGGVVFNHEGIKIAKWLNSLGITAFILKYRLPDDAIMKDKSIGPLQDAQEALRIVRRNCKKWNIDSNKIGIIGFSAGGHLAATLSTHYLDKVYNQVGSISARPDFSILVYPVISMISELTHMGSRENLLGKDPTEQQIKNYSNELMVDKNTPPAFLTHAADDKVVKIENSINYFLALNKNNIPAELHIYQKGGHGFGLIKSKSSEIYLIDSCKNWLTMNGFL